jgi:hypothetical protein
MGCDFDFEIQVLDRDTRVWRTMVTWSATTSCGGGPLFFAAARLLALHGVRGDYGENQRVEAAALAEDLQSPLFYSEQQLRRIVGTLFEICTVEYVYLYEMLFIARRLCLKYLEHIPSGASMKTCEYNLEDGEAVLQQVTDAAEDAKAEQTLNPALDVRLVWFDEDGLCDSIRKKPLKTFTRYAVSSFEITMSD